jgi:hypothetical protein
MASKTFDTDGIGYVLVARLKSPGVIRCACFLVDTFCLGIKNCSFVKLSDGELVSYIQQLGGCQEIVDIEPAYAKKFLESAVTFAAELGFSPHPDFEKYFKSLADVDSSKCRETFKFGKGGKPLFVSGPSDSKKKITSILKKLRNRLGDDSFDYIVSAEGL